MAFRICWMFRAYDGVTVVHVTASGNLQNALNDIISPVLDFQGHWIQESKKVFKTGHVAISGYLSSVG